LANGNQLTVMHAQLVLPIKLLKKYILVHGV